MHDKPNFISISGAAGSGKDTVANYLRDHFHKEGFGINNISFAGPLKDALCLWFDWDRKRLDKDSSYKEGSTLDNGSPDPYCQRLGLTRRQILQKFGTECMRRGMHPDFWIIMADLGLHLGKIPLKDLYIISDARFNNELEWAKSINAHKIRIIRVECPRGEDPTKAINTVTLTTSTNHPSEKEFVEWDGYDEVIINLIDHNLTLIQNMNTLTTYLQDNTIKTIRAKFSLPNIGTRQYK